MSNDVDVLDIEIKPQFTVKDGIFRDALCGFSVDELLNRYSQWGVTIFDLKRALDTIFDE